MGTLRSKVQIRTGGQEEDERGGALSEKVRSRMETIQQSSEVDTPVAPVQDRPPQREGFLSRSMSNLKSLVTPGGIGPRDVAREIPSAAGTVAGTVGRGFTNTFIPATSNFFETTGNIFGEGLAYAVDPNVRKQYNAGNLDIMPTISETTVPDVALDTLAAGIETAIYRSVPDISKMKIGSRTGVGILEGIGFGVAEGIANDKTAEEIVDDLPFYATLGGASNILAPYLLPILKGSIDEIPSGIKRAFKGLKDEVTPGARKASQKAPGNIESPASTQRSFEPGDTYREYAKRNNFEPIIKDEDLPIIDFGDGRPPSKVNLPEITPDTPPSVFTPRTPVAARMSALTKNQRAEVISEARRLSVFNGDTPGMEWNQALETSLARFEARQGEPTSTLRLVPERSTGKAVEQPKVSATKKLVEESPGAQPDNIVPQQRVREVPGEQLPVGEGTVNVSRLEARLTNQLNSPQTANAAERGGISTYRQMSKREQVNKAIRYVSENQEEAMSVLKGEKTPPEGLLHNSIALAMEEVASDTADAALATRLASLRATRQGQEISILTEADPENVVTKIDDIITARKTRAARQRKMKDVSNVDKEVTRTKNEAWKEVSSQRLKVEELERFLNKITC